jgi:hypothetical protein
MTFDSRSWCHAPPFKILDPADSFLHVLNNFAEHESISARTDFRVSGFVQVSIVNRSFWSIGRRGPDWCWRGRRW